VQTIRKVTAALIAEMLTAPDVKTEAETIMGSSSGLPPVAKPLLIELITLINTAGHERGVPIGPEAVDIPEIRELSLRLADVALGFLDYDALKISPLTAPAYTGAPAQAYEAFGKLFVDLRARTEAYMAAKQAAGAGLPVMIDVDIWHVVNARLDNCSRAAHVPLASSADLGTFLIEDVFSRYNIDDFINTTHCFRATALEPFQTAKGVLDPKDPAYLAEPGTVGATTQGDRAGAATNALLFGVMTTLLPLDRQPGDPPSPALAAAYAAADAFRAAHPTFGAPKPRPWLGGTPCYPPGPVSKEIPPGPAPEGAVPS
jgi:hypothetical protein